VSSSTLQERPIALIVEDEPLTLETRTRLFNAHGFQCIGATTIVEALRQFRSTPTVDIVIMDINLNGSDEFGEFDKSGVEFARRLRQYRRELPIVALSGMFSELDEAERDPFDSYMLKGELNVKELETQIDVWRDLALQYRRRRSQSAKSELEKLRQERSIPEIVVNILRDFPPTASGSPRLDLVTPEEMLQPEGWQLRLVQAGFDVSKSERTQIAVAIWLRHENDVTIALLHQHPCIYHDGGTDEEAVQGVLQLMYGYYWRFNEQPTEAIALELEQLRHYLNKVFGKSGKVAGPPSGAKEDVKAEGQEG